MDQQTKSLECPFTWRLDKNLAINLDEDDELYTDVDEEPVLSLVNSIVLTYCRTIKGEHNAAKIKIKETDEIWDKLNLKEIAEEGIATKVLKHVKQATAYHVFHRSGDTSEAALIMATITDSNNLSSVLDQSTLEGCKAIAWLMFHEAGHEFALRHVVEASTTSPNCALWQFLLAKTYRYARKAYKFSHKPSENERQAFLRCYELSTRPYYAIFVAQMHSENKDDDQACKQLYNDIYENCLKKSEIVCVGVLLRLAHAFTKNSDFNRANACLERVQKVKPKNAMFLHYKGIYLMKIKDFEMAKVYLEEATKLKNYAAEMELIQCNKRLNANFDCIEHLKNMLKKYESNKYSKMLCLLHIAMQYYNKKDYVNSADYFQQAINLNIESEQLKNFRNTTLDWKYYNIFNFVYDDLLPKLRELPSGTSSIDTIINDLNIRCEPRTELAQPERLTRCFKAINFRYHKNNNL